MTTAELEEARTAYGARAWEQSYSRLRAVDQVSALDAADLELLAEAAFLTGRDEESVDVWARAYQAFLDAGDIERAAGCAHWLSFHLVNRGEFARAGGWIGRGVKLLADDGHDCVQRGYLKMLTAIQALWQGDAAGAAATIDEAYAIATRFEDADLLTLTTLARGQVLIAQGRTADGVASLDEVMVAVTAGEVSATVAGLAYCAVISECREIFDLRRAHEWSAALTHWCDAQPDLVPYTGWCLIHRAEIMQVHGAWGDAAEAAEHANERAQLTTDHAIAAEAHYILADLYRVRGELTRAEAAYREASRRGREAQPGLALLRLRQGQHETAAATIRRVMDAEDRQVQRASMLAAAAEILLEVGDLVAARKAADELSALSAQYGSPLLEAAATQWQGAVSLAEGDALSSLAVLRRAWAGWQRLDAPYDAARCRVLIGQACRGLGDEDTALMEFDAARWSFMQLEAAPDLSRVESMLNPVAVPPPCGLTAREVEVLRLVSSGRTNRAVAADLVLSEKTVARHLSNIYRKLGVESRAAATAYAYEHSLV